MNGNSVNSFVEQIYLQYQWSQFLKMMSLNIHRAEAFRTFAQLLLDQQLLKLFGLPAFLLHVQLEASVFS